MKVKKCPLCGSTEFYIVTRISGIKFYYIECERCHYCGKAAKTKFFAKLKWNLRQNCKARKSCELYVRGRCLKEKGKICRYFVGGY